jgi:Fur family ferric uptake transcriptional regulator
MSKHFTAEDLAKIAQERGVKIGIATIYRQIDRLISDGIVLRHESPDLSSASFGYFDRSPNEKGGYHLICTNCKRVEHIDCESADSLTSHFLLSHNFHLDKRRTMFYGICANCYNQNL